MSIHRPIHDCAGGEKEHKPASKSNGNDKMCHSSRSMIELHSRCEDAKESEVGWDLCGWDRSIESHAYYMHEARYRTFR